jgi:hypothetical protein
LALTGGVSKSLSVLKKTQPVYNFTKRSNSFVDLKCFNKLSRSESDVNCETTIVLITAFFQQQSFQKFFLTFKDDFLAETLCKYNFQWNTNISMMSKNQFNDFMPLFFRTEKN